jgi:hypothetical protein
MLGCFGTPEMGDRRLGIYLKLPASCRNMEEPVGAIEESAYLERWQLVVSANGCDYRPLTQTSVGANAQSHFIALGPNEVGRGLGEPAGRPLRRLPAGQGTRTSWLVAALEHHPASQIPAGRRR